MASKWTSFFRIATTYIAEKEDIVIQEEFTRDGAAIHAAIAFTVVYLTQLEFKITYVWWNVRYILQIGIP